MLPCMKTQTTEEEVKVLSKEIKPFIKKATTVVKIENAQDMTTASELRTQLKKYLKQVTDKKETLTKPLYAVYKTAMGMFAPLEEDIKEQIKAIDTVMISYQTAEKKRADEEAAKIEKRIGEGKGKLKFETAVDKIAEIDKPESKVATESGGTQFFTHIEVSVEDITKVPHKYLEVNLPMIRAELKLGNRIPGIKYDEQQRPKDMR